MSTTIYQPNDQDKEGLAQIRKNFEKLLGSRLVFSESNPRDHMLAAAVPLPMLEKRGEVDKSMYRYRGYHLLVLVIKNGSMKAPEFIISFWREVDMRLYRQREWQEARRGSHIMEQGSTPEEVWGKFMTRFGSLGYQADGLGSSPWRIAEAYYNAGGV